MMWQVFARILLTGLEACRTGPGAYWEEDRGKVGARVAWGNSERANVGADAALI